ncbi:hypothetical protein B9Z55_003389 [Caenorhabditis nigoni]|nr:hypothetical protein B9Z55_003389 [Caenorhabditis nigoni]
MLSKALSEAFKIQLVTKIQEVVGNDIDLNDLFNSPSKPEGAQNNKNNNISVEYDYPSSEGNDQEEEGIYEYIDEFSKPVLFFKKHYRKILAVLFLASLVVVSILVFLIVLPVSHHPGTATTSKVSPDTTPTYTTATTKVQTTTESEDTSCIPTDYPKTTLYAYSNDLSPEAVLHSWKAFKDFNNDSRYKWYGSVRFDIEHMNIQFHTSTNDVNKTILSDMPNRDQGFRESSIGSNVFNVIEKFFSNQQEPVCGAIICVLLKRYPNETDISQLVSLIRYHHAILHVITSATPSGGSQSKTMYSVASKTNGIGAFVMDANFKTFHSVHSEVSICAGPILLMMDTTHLLHVMLLMSFFATFHLNVNALQADGTLKGGTWVGIHKGNYRMSLDYGYLGPDVQNLQIRLYGTV